MATRRLALLVLIAACDCTCQGRSAAPGTVRLEIPDRGWASEAPKEGWCGEASIQMAALHFGAYVPQALINRLGRPKTPDLWEQDIPVALTALGLEFTTFSGHIEIPAFLSWIASEVRQGHPVIIGVKIYPSAHPDWNVDHLVLVVGVTPDALIINTNAPEQITYGLAQLSTQSKYSLVSPGGKLHGFAISGFSGLPITARVTEQGASVSLEVRVRGLAPGVTYQLVRDDLQGGKTASTFTATSYEEVLHEQTPADKAAVFFCRHANGG